MSSNKSLCPNTPYQSSICTSSVPHTRHMLHPSYFSSFGTGIRGLITYVMMGRKVKVSSVVMRCYAMQNCKYLAE
jgi:hypothetical protein